MSTQLATLGAEFGSRAAEFFTMRYAFALDALGASVLVGAVCALVGTFLVLRGLSLVGDATGHATLPGVAVGFLIAGGASTGWMLAGALGSALLAALLIGVIGRGPRTRPDAAIGIVLSVFFGLGIVLISYIQSTATGAQAGLGSFLFGNAAGVTRSQLYLLGGVCAAFATLVVVFYRPLMLTVFDEGFARSIGVPTRLVQAGLLGALSVCVVLSIQAVGVVLVAAMLIIPPSTALFFSSRLPRVLAIASGAGAVSGAVGAFVSFLAEGVATGPAMVLVASAIFAVALLVGPRGGLLHTRRARRRAAVASDQARLTRTPLEAATAEVATHGRAAHPSGTSRRTL